MHKTALAALLFSLTLLPAAVGCSTQAEAPAGLPPAGLAGAPGSTAAPIAAPTAAGAVDPSAPLPPGHPPIDSPHGGEVIPGGDDGAPLSPKAGQAPLPHFAGLAGGGHQRPRCR